VVIISLTWGPKTQKNKIKNVNAPQQQQKEKKHGHIPWFHFTK
jgi:hypothetical protein